MSVNATIPNDFHNIIHSLLSNNKLSIYSNTPLTVCMNIQLFKPQSVSPSIVE